jgi:hypothetical protein
MCLNCAGDLHRCQHKTPGRVEYEIDRHIVGSFLDRRDDRLSTLQINVPRDRKAENSCEAPLCGGTSTARTFAVFPQGRVRTGPPPLWPQPACAGWGHFFHGGERTISAVYTINKPSRPDHTENESLGFQFQSGHAYEYATVGN